MKNVIPRIARLDLVGLLSILGAVVISGCGSADQSPTQSKQPAPQNAASSADEKVAEEKSPSATPAGGKKPEASTPVVEKKESTTPPAKPAAAQKQAPAPPPKQEPPQVASTREEADAMFTKVGGKVFYDDKQPEKPATLVRFQNRHASDAVMGNLAFFPEITQLDIIYPSNITDASLEHVGKLTNLQAISFEGTRITDAGLAHLKGLPNVERLRLINTRIGDDGLAHLKGMTKLTQLLIAFTDVSDEGLVHLEGLTNLKLLELDDTKVTQAGVDRIKKALPKCNVQWSPNSGAPTVASAPEAGGDKPSAPAALASTKDWPSWRGPNRDAHSSETGLLQEWPAEGPKLLWTANGIGNGYSTVAISNGRFFVTGRVGGADGGTSLFAYDLNGKQLWERPICKDRFYPFAMPTVDGDLVYAISHEGDLVCAKTSDGEIVWRKHFVTDFGGDYMARGGGGGYAESVLIDGDLLICTPGAKDAMLVALNKKTGELIWKAAFPEDVGSQGQDAAGMASPVISNACGIKQYVQLAGRGLIGVEAATGKTLWAYNGIANSFANIPTPIVSGDYVFASTVQASDRTAGTALVKLVPDNGGIKPEVVYRLDYRTAANHHGGMVLVGDYVYMGHGHNRGFPLCIELKTGKVVWRPGRGPGNGSVSLLYAEGNLYFRYEDGTVALVEATPKAFAVTSKFNTPPDTDAEWAHPVICDGKLYLRGQNRVLCYDIKRAPGDAPAKTTSNEPAQTPEPAVAVKTESPAEPVPTVDEAIAGITKVGGRVFFDEKDPNKPLIGVRLPNKNITDDVMANLRPLTGITRLDVVYPNSVTDAGFAHVAGLTELKEVDLEGTDISDAGLANFTGMNKLQRLRLINTRVTGKGMVYLSKLPKLNQLYLSFTEVDDEGVEHLEKIKTLWELELDDSKVSEEGVNRLRKALPKCKVLWNPNRRAGEPVKQAAIPADLGPGPSDGELDWAQWRGPKRDGLCREVGLLTEWPDEGPPLLWNIKGVGAGYSTVAVVQGRLYTTGRFGGGKKPGTYLLCLDAESGKQIWERFIVDDKNVPLSMPTIDGDRIYALAHEGDLLCANLADGEVVWQKNLMQEFGGDYMARGGGGGYSESVLIDGDKLICTPAKDAALAALNKNTGEFIWKAGYPDDVGSQGVDLAGFSSPVISNACGIRQYVQMSGRGLISVAADTGKTLWSYNKIANNFANIPTPIVEGDYVFASTVHAADIVAGTALVKLVPDGDGIKVEEVYRLSHRTAANHHGGMVLLGDHVYMGHGYNRGFPMCLEFKTGKVAWRPGRGPGVGSAAVLYADGHLYFRYEDGTMALIEARPDVYKLKGTFKPPPDYDMEWAHPVIANGRLYLRGKDQLLCYNVAR